MSELRGCRLFRFSRQQGFSMVELLVALLFTSILMAGLASVFRSSLTTFYASGEKISSLRRNRSAIDLIADDLNNAGMYLYNLHTPPTVSPINPPFYIIPSATDTSGGTGVTKGSDAILFYVDEALPFEATLDSSAGGGTAIKSNADLVVDGGSQVGADDTMTYVIDCKQASNANMVHAGQSFMLRDSSKTVRVRSILGVNGAKVTVLGGGNPDAGITGDGPAEGNPTEPPIHNTSISFLRLAQMVRYTIQDVILDPVAGAVPCLVRDQGNYAPGGFVPDPAQRQIVAENVSGFRVFLSVDSGVNWLGGHAYNGRTWNDLRTDLDSALNLLGRPGFTTTQGNEHWFREIPVLVRIDVTTRTATQRTEFNNTATPTLAFHEQTQSVIMLPRHFGLSMK